MQVAVRSYLTAGVALVGAGAIVAAPITPTPPDIQVPAIYSAQVELAALANPIELWAEVIATSVGNVGTLAQTVLAAPAPILGSVVGNQLITAQVMTSFVTTFGQNFVGAIGEVPAALQAAVGEILAGNISVGVQAVAGGLLAPVLAGAFAALPQLADVTAVLQNPFLNMANVIGTVVSINTLISLGLPLLTEALAPVFQLAATAQSIFDGVRTGDLEAVANALISFPSDMVGTILNGSAVGGNAGLLSSPYGLFAGLLTLRQAIADAITPPVLAPAPVAARTLADTSPDIASIPEATAAMVSLEEPSTPAAETEPAAEPETEAAADANAGAAEEETDATDVQPATPDDDTRTDTKDGNMAVPGEVNTGPNGTDTPSTPSDDEPAPTTGDPDPAEPAAETDDPADAGAGDADSGASDAGGNDGGDE